jgi:hypothetical protein
MVVFATMLALVAVEGLFNVGLVLVAIGRCGTKPLAFDVPTTSLMATTLLAAVGTRATHVASLLEPVELKPIELVLFTKKQSSLVVDDGRRLVSLLDGAQPPPRRRC